MSAEAYKVRLDSFEGPMELLMHLIDVNKVDIYDIPIASITEQYLDYLDGMKRFDIEIASEFLVMAATLLLIKSRMMLPKPPEEKEEEDPRSELVARILEYRRFKKASLEMKNLAEVERQYVKREPTELPLRRLPLEGLSVAKLARIFRSIIALRKELSIPEEIVAHEEYRVEERIMSILAHLAASASGNVSFDEMFEAGSRAEMVATFLALLELIRRKAVNARQSALFASITIETREGPFYGGESEDLWTS